MEKYKKLFLVVAACVILTFSMVILHAPPALAYINLSISPVTSSSSPGYVGQKITLNGVDFQPSATITIKYSTTPITVATTTSNASGDFSIDFDAPKSFAGTHTITASDGINSLQVLFYMEAEAPPIPQPLSPENGAIIAPLARFDWESVEDESGVTYDLQIATSFDFASSSTVLSIAGITESEYTLTYKNTLQSRPGEEPYYWRVKAVDGASNESGWSGAGEFYVESTTTSTNGSVEEVDPDKGVVGTEVTVEGRGYRPNSALEVTYDHDAIDIESGDSKTDSKGDFLFSIIIPENPVGNHTIMVCDDAGSEGETTFKVEPEVSISPVTALPFSMVTIYGTGFGAERDITITLCV